jgi:hypothetical protein
VIRPKLLIVVQTYPDGGGISAIVENLVHRFDGPFDVHLAVVELREGTSHQLDLAPERLHACGFSNAINPLLMPFSLAYTVLVGRFLRKVVDSVRPAALLTQSRRPPSRRHARALETVRRRSRHHRVANRGRRVAPPAV